MADTALASMSAASTLGGMITGMRLSCSSASSLSSDVCLSVLCDGGDGRDSGLSVEVLLLEDGVGEGTSTHIPLVSGDREVCKSCSGARDEPGDIGETLVFFSSS